MKKTLLTLFVAVITSTMMTSCWTYTITVGSGAQTGIETQKKNHYLIQGLAPLDMSDPNQMAGDAENYDITITHSFIDGLISAITFGIYTPTTTIVRK
ncbi:MAG: Bor family protein [Bacteroidota bacterium]